MIVFPGAKINIGLNVVSQRSDGYHNLETVFYPVPLMDILEMAESEMSGIAFSGIQIDGASENNLVMKAYRLLQKEFELPPVKFHLHKVIPPGSGLGGGSTNAAITLKMLNNYFQLQLSNDRLRSYAVQLGADCPFFIDNEPAFATGIGDALSPFPLNLPDYRLVLIIPGIPVNTGQAYREIVPAKPGFDLRNIIGLPVEEWKDVVVNDFEKVVFLRYPEIEKWKNTLYELGALYASMSGSGSALFGIFSDLPADLNIKIPESVLFVC